MTSVKDSKGMPRNMVEVILAKINEMMFGYQLHNVLGTGLGKVLASI